MKVVASCLGIIWIATILPCAASEGGGSEGADVLKKIIRDWEHRRQSIRSVEYQLEGQAMIPKGRWTGDPALPPSVKGSVPEQDYSYDISVTTILDFEKGFAKVEERREEFYLHLVKFIPYQRIQLYNGERYVVHRPRETNTGAGYTPSAKQPDLWEDPNVKFFFSGEDAPGLLLSGRFRDGRWDVRKLDEITSLRSFTFVGKGKLSGRDCIILRLNSTIRPGNHQEFWFDTGPGSVLLRWINYVGESVFEDIHFSYASGGSEGWPQSWEFAWYLPPQKLRLQDRMRLKSLKLNKNYPRSLFQIERSPGMVVATSKGFFRVNEDRSLIEVPLTEGSPSPSQTGWRWVYLGGILALFALCVCVMVARKRLWPKRQTRSSSP